MKEAAKNTKKLKGNQPLDKFLSKRDEQEQNNNKKESKGKPQKVQLTL
jgi:hypothetical protein